MEMGLAEPAPTTWTIPLTYRPLLDSTQQPASFIWLSNQTARVTAPTSLERDTYLFNVGESLPEIHLPISLSSSELSLGRRGGEG